MYNSADCTVEESLRVEHCTTNCGDVMLQADIQRTLRARMQVLLADAEDSADAGSGPPQIFRTGEAAYADPFTVQMPQRIFLPIQVRLQYFLPQD